MGVRRAVAVASLLLAGAAASPAGEVRGVVRLEGAPPPPAVVTITPQTGEHSTEGCGSLTKRSQRLVVQPDGGVQNAVVWLEAPAAPAGKAAATTVVLDQRECVLVPHVLIVPPGGELAIRNSDQVLHNVRIFQGATMLMHAWQPARPLPDAPPPALGDLKPAGVAGQAGAAPCAIRHGKADRSVQPGDLTWRFDAPGRYLVRCGAHPWMYAWVIAAEHVQYAVSDASGRFAISEVPVGRYTLRVWHETLGEQEQSVRVGAEQTEVAIRLSQEGRTSWE